MRPTEIYPGSAIFISKASIGEGNSLINNSQNNRREIDRGCSILCSIVIRFGSEFWVNGHFMYRKVQFERPCVFRGRFSTFCCASHDTIQDFAQLFPPHISETAVPCSEVGTRME